MQYRYRSSGDLVLGVVEGISFGSGDACIGINPVEDNFESTNRIAQKVFEFVKKYDVPTQITVLSHITTQMNAMRRGTPLSMIFQSIAGTEKTNDSFGVTKKLIQEAYQVAFEFGISSRLNLLYFETGETSKTISWENSWGKTRTGVPQMAHEKRTHG